MNKPYGIDDLEAIADIGERYGMNRDEARSYLRHVGYLSDERPAS